MRLRPRHYVLIAVILGIGVFNIVRARRPRGPQTVSRMGATGTAPSSPAWTAFDKAAGLRDAPEDQFSTALQDLQRTEDSAGKDPTFADVKGCQVWLLYYRQQVLHPSRDPSWKQRSAEHLDSCVKTHQDIGQ